MQVTVTGRHFDVAPNLRRYVDVRLQRMHRFLDKIDKAHVTLAAEKRGHRAEILLQVNGHDFAVKDTAEDAVSAVDRVADKLEKQLRRYKDKRATARKSGPRREASTNGEAERVGTLRVLRAESVGQGAELHEILRAQDHPIEQLSVDEALARLEDLDEGFLVFSNRGNDHLHIVYRTPDGNFGVLNLHASA
jgi:putative sigma-54 modulation protein